MKTSVFNQNRRDSEENQYGDLSAKRLWQGVALPSRLSEA